MNYKKVKKTPSVFSKNEEIINELYSKMDETFAKREKKPTEENYALWSKACEEFHSKYDSLAFPGGLDRAYYLVIKGDKTILESAIGFLEADPYFHRSGYMKEHIWKYLHKFQLNERQKDRLQKIGIGYLERKVSREFWYMARAITRIASEEFWQEIEKMIATDDLDVQQRAHYLSTYRFDINKGEEEHRKVQKKIKQQRMEW